MTFRLVPPAGTPVRWSDQLRAISLRLSGTDANDVLTKKIQHITEAKYCYFVNSGRTGLALILKALARMSEPVKNELVIPAYTCFSVAAAVVRAGLKIRLVDVDPETLDYDYDQLRTIPMENVLGIVGCNLFGIPSDWNALKALANDHGIFLIDDAAQAMGSRYGERAMGLNGDVGFYSLDRGKNMTAYSGGIVVTDRTDVAEHLTELVSALPGSGAGSEIGYGMKFCVYGNFLHPRCYWLPSMLPFLGLGETVFDESFEMRRLSRYQTAAAATLIDHLPKYNNVRVANSKTLSEELAKSGRFTIPGYGSDNFPVYLRLPLLCQDGSTRDRAVVTLKKKGIVASTMYPSTLEDIPGLESHTVKGRHKFSGSHRVVETLIALPTHPYVSQSDIIKMISILTDL